MSDRGMPRLLLLDHYDSFVLNLARYLRLAGATTEVVRADAVSADDVLAEIVDGVWNGVVLSPGPGRPADVGVAVELIRRIERRALAVPMLGVCLGHQAIGEALGGEVVRVGPRHAMTSRVRHDGTGVFEGLPADVEVGRYHSLAVRRFGLPECLRVTAVSDDDDVVMGVSHRTLPIHGVQFHPESVLTPDGQTMASRFVAMCMRTVVAGAM